MRVALSIGMIPWALLAALPAVTVSKIQIVEGMRVLSDAELKTYINAARCTCDASFTVRFDVTSANEDGSLAVVYGKRCIDSDMRLSSSCKVLWEGTLTDLKKVETEVRASEVATCNDDASTDSLIVVADPNDEDIWQEIAKLELPSDAEAPKPPEKAKVLGGEGLAEVIFEKAGSTEKLQYQVLCEKAGEPVLDNPPDAAFVSAYDTCGAGGEVIAEKFVCAEAGGVESVTVLGLENGQTYKFYVVSIDPFGNPSDAAEAGEATPAPELDLWEVYRKKGGSADGGHCFVATAAYGDYDHPQVVTLRRFRDGVLKQSDAGRWLVALYYENSPPLAAWIARSDERRQTAQLFLWPITSILSGLLP